VTFHDWYVRILPELEADPGRRDDNVLIAKELLPIFERSGGQAWRALRFLHSHGSHSSLEDYLSGWTAACDADVASVAKAIQDALRPD